MEACSVEELQAMTLCLKHIAISRKFLNETIPMKFNLSICSLWLDFACIRCTNNYAYPQAMKFRALFKFNLESNNRRPAQTSR